MIYDIPEPADYVLSVYDRADRTWTRVPGHPDLWQHADVVKPWRNLVAMLGPIRDKDLAQ